MMLYATIMKVFERFIHRHAWYIRICIGISWLHDAVSNLGYIAPNGRMIS